MEGILTESMFGFGTFNLRPTIMSTKEVIPVFCAVLISCLVLSEAQIYDTQAASLSKAPVGLYSRHSIFGGSESASSLSGALVGLYSKRQLPQYPFKFPAVYYSPFFFGLPNYKFPFLQNVKAPVQYRPPAAPKPPTKPGSKPSKINPRLLGGVLGGLLGGLL